jgi:tetratricopeptide (TPR) repeat protein
LEAVELSDEAHWRWRLTDERGALLADHAVALDREAAEYQGFVDPYRFLRWYADPAGGLEGERALVERLGRWIGERVWGAVGDAIAERARRAPVVVHVSVPSEAKALIFLPLELGFVGERPLALQDVSLVFELAGAVDGEKAPVGKRLRMLALFSAPIDQAALNARYERYELRQLVHRIALTAGRAIELRVLQYGVTREVLREVLAEYGGWDAIHFSGHGLPAGLVLEHSDGTADLVSSDELCELLWPVRGQLKLVTLSSCESAAATVAQTMQLLGLPAPAAGEDAEDRSAERSLPAVAHGLVERLGCAALAMRYPVSDEFAIALARHLYGALFKDGQPLPRALQVAIGQASAPDGSGVVPPLSIATPTLLGAAALELSLEPPRAAPGQPAIFDLTTAGLAYFPPEPQRFVGRVGALAGASGALAPASRHRAVLFHGMAGAGKTACALELTYRHQERRFEAMAWYSAPLEGQDIVAALAGFAVALETQLEGLELAHVVDDRGLLERYLPRVTRALGDRAVLIVLDNIESLLTAEGAWRDERWALVIEALIAHDGLSRLVLTSRQVPQSLTDDGRVLIERIDTLSASESVLLARQLPNLGALIQTDGDQDAGRELARRVLETVQGNPKLIELADRQAGDPAVLSERLDEAAAAWGDGAGRLAAFFLTGQPDRDYEAKDFLRVLETWTAGAAGRLPEDARTAFHLICALEEADRLGFVVDGNWADLWQALGRPGEPPDPHAALGVVADHGLIDIRAGEKRRFDRYHVHPAVEHAGLHAAGGDFQTAVDAEMAAFWSEVFTHGLEGEAHDQKTGQVIVRAGLAAAPYLLRLNRPSDAQFVLERVIRRDQSSRTLAAVLPQLEQVVSSQDAGTREEFSATAFLLEARGILQPAEVLQPTRDLLKRVVQAQYFELASAIAGDLVRLLLRAGRLEEALTLSESKADYTRIAGMGPWAQLGDEAVRLTILKEQGRSELVLAEAEALRGRMDALAAGDGREDQAELVEKWNVRELILNLARSVAMGLDRFETALELNQEISASKHDRAASPLELARATLNDYGPLLSLKRYKDAEKLLRECRRTFEAEESRESLALVYSAWADLEGSLHRYEQAISFERRALRLDYALGGPGNIAADHFNLASYLALAGQDPALVLVHRLAAALIAYQTVSGELVTYLSALNYLLGDGGEQALPESFAAVCERLRQAEEIDFAQLFAALPATAATGEDALREVIPLAQTAPVEHLLEQWKQPIAATVAAAQGDTEARSALDSLLAKLAQSEDWSVLSATLRMIVAGERDRKTLLAELDPTDTAIVSAILDRL